MANGIRCSVTNILYLLRDVKYFRKPYLAPIQKKDATIVDLESERKL